MRVTADTNILVRTLVRDDSHQAVLADQLLKRATLVVLTLPSLCELAWILRAGYKLGPSDVALAIKALLNASNVETNRPAVEAGLAMLERGGDFADGVIAHEGQWLGAEQFVSFDRRAVGMLQEQGVAARLLE